MCVFKPASVHTSHFATVCLNVGCGAKRKMIAERRGEKSMWGHFFKSLGRYTHTLQLLLTKYFVFFVFTGLEEKHLALKAFFYNTRIYISVNT